MAADIKLRSESTSRRERRGIERNENNDGLGQFKARVVVVLSFSIFLSYRGITNYMGSSSFQREFDES